MRPETKSIAGFAALICMLTAIFGCSGPPVTAPVTKAEMIPEEEVNQYAHIYGWQGNINGKTPVLMWYREFGDVLTGVAFYTESKQTEPVAITGYLSRNVYHIFEMDNAGLISGEWQITPHYSAAEGSYYSPLNSEHYNASLMHIDTMVSVPGVETRGNVSGLYAFRYAGNGAAGLLNVSQKDDSVQLLLRIKKPGLTAYTEAINTHLKIRDNEVHYFADQYSRCGLRIHFYENFAYISYLHDKQECSFSGQKVEGIYAKAP